MANIRIDLDHELLHGEELVFKAPCDCTAVSGIKVYYPSTSGTVSKTLLFKDAHGNVLTNINNLFSSGVLIKVLVDSTDGYAYILNADTNAYLEAKTTPVDNLESDRADLSLSAKMGKKLRDLSLMYNESTDCFGIMHNGTWYDIMFAGLKKIYAYAKGNEYTALSGGWSNANNTWGIHGSVTRNGTVIKHANFMEFKVNNSSSRYAAFVGTANKINLLNYKQIIFTFINPNNNYVITKTLDIETISIKEQYIVCGLDYAPNGQCNGLVWAVSPIIGNLQTDASGCKFDQDQAYAKYDKMYLESVELIPVDI